MQCGVLVARAHDASPVLRLCVVSDMQMWKDFREFAFKGNVVDLAIGVIIGGAFGKIVTALVTDIIMPLIALVLPSGEWRQASLTLRERPPAGPDGDVRLLLGDLASDVVDFLIVGFVLFLVVRAINQLKKLHPAEPANRECPECLEKVAYHAKRCKFCASELPPLADAAPAADHVTG
jgi:large conductance mechanosensitive channel